MSHISLTEVEFDIPVLGPSLESFGGEELETLHLFRTSKDRYGAIMRIWRSGGQVFGTVVYVDTDDTAIPNCVRAFGRTFKIDFPEGESCGYVLVGQLSSILIG